MQNKSMTVLSSKRAGTEECDKSENDQTDELADLLDKLPD